MRFLWTLRAKSTLVETSLRVKVFLSQQLPGV